jgi:3D (Asp-Asp-Asp) domain-containing protein
MKKLTRLAGLLSLAIFAVGLMAASSASATGYLLLPVGGTVTGTSTVGTLKAASNVINCTKDEFKATIASVHLVGPFQVKFTGCTAKGKTNSGCAVNSKGTSGGEILTNTLHALIGLALPSNTPALLVLPGSGHTWFELAASTEKSGTETVECTVATTVAGNLVGLLAQGIGTKTTKAALKFVNNDPETIDLPLGGKVVAELEYFGVPGTFETVESLVYGQSSELMP